MLQRLQVQDAWPAGLQFMGQIAVQPAAVSLDHQITEGFTSLAGLHPFGMLQQGRQQQGLTWRQPRNALWNRHPTSWYS